MSVPSGFRALPLPIAQLSLAAVLKCGQSFRWSIFPLPDQISVDELTPTHEYRFCLRDRVVCLQQNHHTLFYRSVFSEPLPSPTHVALKEAETLAWLRDYFQLDIDLLELYEEWSNRDPVFGKFQSRFSGIRMLRQDPWENLVSFICSSNNNISRISKMVNSLCRYYSQPLVFLAPPPSSEGSVGDQVTQSYHPFPPPSALAAPEVSSVLRSLGFGYRAEFIQRTAEMLVTSHGSKIAQGSCEASEAWLMTLRDVNTSEAREELLKFVGVGRKVADCILLMSLDKKEVIPVDTHVHQIAIKHYGIHGKSGTKVNMTPKLYDEVNSKLAKVWGDYAGWAHSVLFTADLKSFSTYGLPLPSPFQSNSANKKTATSFPMTPPQTPSPPPSKRKRALKAEIITGQGSTISTEVDEYSLAERVKRRRSIN